MQLPEKIRAWISDETYETNHIGMSEACVLVFGDKVLKVQECGDESENEFRMLTWLRGKLPVPHVFAYERMDDKAYLLMSKCSGRMMCEPEYMRDPVVQVKVLAAGLRRLWQTDITGCPSDCRLQNKLAQAMYQVEHGLVDLNNVEPDIFGPDGFKNPEALLQWLYDHQSKEEPVLSHGDYCLPNILGIGNEVSGYIDLGRAGIADKWCDIALCYRSLSHNYSGRYHGQKYFGYDDLLLFQELGIEPDWEKIHYYILLDELF